MTNFEKAVEVIFHHEGGYVNHPKDPGGETKYGISKRAYPNINIAELTKESAAEIYKKDYWNKVRGDSLPYPIALIMFDMAVNMGVRRSIKMAQKVAGAKRDGVFGPKTLKAITDLNVSYFCASIVSDRIIYYSELSTFETFKRGWISRSVDVLIQATQQEGQ